MHLANVFSRARLKKYFENLVLFSLCAKRTFGKHNISFTIQSGKFETFFFTCKKTYFCLLELDMNTDVFQNYLFMTKVFLCIDP